MFDLFKRKESPSRKQLREEFENITGALRRADATTQTAVGHSINMANSMFIKRFGSQDAFCQIPTSERFEYINSLCAFEEKINQQDPSVALGFGLFKMWVGALSERDHELMSQFSKELGYFSRLGDLPA